MSHKIINNLEQKFLKKFEKIKKICQSFFSKIKIFIANFDQIGIILEL